MPLVSDLDAIRAFRRCVSLFAAGIFSLIENENFSRYSFLYKCVDFIWPLLIDYLNASKRNTTLSRVKEMLLMNKFYPACGIFVGARRIPLAILWVAIPRQWVLFSC